MCDHFKIFLIGFIIGTLIIMSWKLDDINENLETLIELQQQTEVIE